MMAPGVPGIYSSAPYGLAVDPSGEVVLTGLTSSSSKNPTPVWPGNSGEENAFVAKFSFVP